MEKKETADLMVIENQVRKLSFTVRDPAGRYRGETHKVDCVYNKIIQPKPVAA